MITLSLKFDITASWRKIMIVISERRKVDLGRHLEVSAFESNFYYMPDIYEDQYNYGHTGEWCYHCTGSH